MQTLTDPFELASRALPVSFEAMVEGVGGIPVVRPEPAEDKEPPRGVLRGDAWARVRFWCSED